VLDLAVRGDLALQVDQFFGTVIDSREPDHARGADPHQQRRDREERNEQLGLDRRRDARRDVGQPAQQP
jgi:hypothetical protein